MIAPSAADDVLRRLADVPRRRLAIVPSPLHEVPRLAAAVGGPELWLKRDDLLGFGFGGNKVRGLELLVADALAAGADTLVTGAGPQSNHVRATAATAAVAGLDMVAVYWGTEPAASEGNLRLTRLFGAETRFTGESDRTSVDRGIAAVAAELRAAGRHPYEIPRGGATALGVVAHVLAADELHRQARERDRVPELVVVAVGSGATLAGWLLGTAVLGLRWRVVGYTVSRPAEEARARVSALAGETAAILGIDSGAAVDDRIDIRDGVIGDGYGIPTAAGQAAIELVARREGILLDPTYTAKAFGGYLADVAADRFGRVGRTVFLHTGGEPALFVGGR
jgi:1-aminocyclopropane-1-carboxylate deaminase/D-cysteine desulfhydrase-like pyridoxal-dependent ACC family enzyme